MSEWKTYEVDEIFPRVKNKKVKAIYVDKNNVDEVEKETQAFAKFNDNCLCTGFLSFTGIPAWMININPKGKVKKYIFENDRTFQKFFKEVSEK